MGGGGIITKIGSWTVDSGVPFAIGTTIGVVCAAVALFAAWKALCAWDATRRAKGANNV